MATQPGTGAHGAASLAAFARSCTLHGLGHVFVPGTPAPRRLLWAGAFLASLGAFLLQAGERVRHFAAYPHVTVLDEAESRVLAFPAVTLCNYNRIRRSQLTPNDLFWLGKELLAVEREDFSRYLRALGQPADFTGFFPSKSYDLAAFYQRAGHPIRDMLLSCRFRGRDCGPENFTAVSATVAAASAVAVAGSAACSSALGRTHSSPHPLPLPHPHPGPALPPGWLCPGQGLGRTQGRAGWGVRRLGDSGVHRLRVVGRTGCGAMGCAGCGVAGCTGCGAVSLGHGSCPPFPSPAPGAW